MADASRVSITFQGRTIEAAALTEGQLAVLIRTRRESEVDALHHMCRVIQGAVGRTEWDTIDDGMAMGTVGLDDVLALASQLMDATIKARTAAPVEDEEAAMMAKLAEIRAAKEAGASA